jgi:hypothetical protein
MITMLPDRQRELLTAFLDGQLSPRQHKAVLRLLHRSSEARDLLRQLQEDSHALRGLPRHSLPADFPFRVLRVAAERGLRPGMNRTPLQPRRVPAWAGLATAAAVLLTVGTGTFLYFGGGESAPEGVAVGKPNVPVPPRNAPPPETGVRLALNDLGQEAGRTLLAKELRRGTAHHLALDAGDPARTVKHLEAALRRNGIQLLADPAVTASLARRQPGKGYLVYVENVRPEELAVVLRHATPAAAHGSLDQDSMLINLMSEHDRTHLARLLGIPVGQLQLPKAPAIPLHEPPIFVPEKHSGKEPANATPPQPKGPDRLAVVLAYDGNNSAPSAEVRRFLAARRHHYTGTLQVYLVVHDASL